ncbi:MAG: hypothetical protein ACJ8DZ_08250 [Allosphingosinicella sp.]
MKCRFAFALAIGLAWPGIAAARPLPKLEDVASPSERRLIDEVQAAALLRDGAPESALARLDSVLRQLPRPTRFRGLVQIARALLLDALRDTPAARPAVAEAIKLLPGETEPLLLAAHVEAYGGRIADAADFVLRAEAVDPAAAELLDDYELANILRRLDDAGEDARLAAVSERFLLAGWSRGRPDTISRMALTVIRARAEAGKAADAVPFVQRISDPHHLMPVMTERRYEALWPAAESWAGARFEKMWPRYLEQTRLAWRSAETLETARGYLGALSAAGHDRMAVAEFLPRMAGPIRPEDVMFIYIAVDLASALARLDRWDEAYAVLDKGARTWPIEATAFALNFSANRGRLLVQQGRFVDALAELDRAIADSARWGAEVNSSALSQMHLARACALEQLGRAGEDTLSSAVIVREKKEHPVPYARWRICAGDVAGARQALLEGLSDATLREDVIQAVQPSRENVYPSDYARIIERRWLALRTDPALLAAVSRYARILPAPASASAPPDPTPLPH